VCDRKLEILGALCFYAKSQTGSRGALNSVLVIPQPILEWLDDVVLASDRTEQAARAQAMKKLQTRCDQIQTRIETMYLDKLEGRITQEFFDKQSSTWRGEQDGLLRKIQNIQKATPAPIDQAVDMLRLASRASELFLQQPAAEQRRLLQVVVGKAAWRSGALQTTLFAPFEILRHSNQEVLERKGKRWIRTRFGNLAPLRGCLPNLPQESWGWMEGASWSNWPGSR
jgi:hypothetical protein